MCNTPPDIIVTGASNQIGYYLLERLKATSFTVTACSRNITGRDKNIQWQRVDLLRVSLPIQQESLLFHCAPLPLASTVIERLPQPQLLKRVIAFSSTSRLTKQESSDPKERIVANQLAEAEQKLITTCQHANIPWTVFRPTLIYGCGRDKNMTTIVDFIRRFHFFPIVGKGSGLRQPVHADDLALACLQAYNNPNTFNKTYHLSGGQTLTYREMVEAVFRQLGKKPCIIPIPLNLFQLLARSIHWLPRYAHLSPAMVARINTDLCFEHSAAAKDFAYHPRPLTLDWINIH